MGLSFKDWQTRFLAPVWLRRTWGARLLGVLGEAKDRIVQAAKDAAKVGLPDQAPVDALPYNGAGRNIERYAADTDATYRARIVAAWDVWEFAGTTAGLLARLADQGYPNAHIVPWRAIAPDVPAAYVAWWSAFWIWIEPPHGFASDGIWGDPGTWDDVAPGPPPGPGTWDSDATLYAVSALRAAIRKWKPAEQICAGVWIVLGDDLWEDAAPFDHGAWDDTTVLHLRG